MKSLFCNDKARGMGFSLTSIRSYSFSQLGFYMEDIEKTQEEKT